MIAKREHEVAHQDLTALLNRHAAKISAAEMLAIAANMVGKMIAMQDQRTMTTDRAMKIVAANIEIGNQQVMDQLSQSAGRT